MRRITVALSAFALAGLFLAGCESADKDASPGAMSYCNVCQKECPHAAECEAHMKANPGVMSGDEKSHCEGQTGTCQSSGKSGG